MSHMINIQHINYCIKIHVNLTPCDLFSAEIFKELIYIISPHVKLSVYDYKGLATLNLQVHIFSERIYRHFECLIRPLVYASNFTYVHI